MENQYFVHNGYCGWSYGTPSNPQLITAADALRLMQVAGISQDQVELFIPPAQYAEEGELLFKLTGGNRFIVFATASEMADVQPTKVSQPLHIGWPT